MVFVHRINVSCMDTVLLCHFSSRSKKQKFCVLSTAYPLTALCAGAKVCPDYTLLGSKATSVLRTSPAVFIDRGEQQGCMADT